MRADPTTEEQIALSTAAPADCERNGESDSAESAAGPAKPKRKRAPRPTFDDGALTRVFKFPSKKFPKSSYYVTGTEIIIRIKKARKRWKLVVPKKRLVSYRTNRWFAKPRWVEIELTYTQAVRHGLVEPSAPRAQPDAADPIADVLTPATLPAADDTSCDATDASAESVEPDGDEIAGWVVDEDDGSAATGDETYDTFEETAADEPAEIAASWPASETDEPLAEAQAISPEDDREDTAVETEKAPPSSFESPTDAPSEIVEQSAADGDTISLPASASIEASDVSAESPRLETECEPATPAEPPRIENISVLAAVPSSEPDTRPLPAYVRMPPPHHRNRGARGLASALAVALLCFSANLGRLGDGALDAEPCGYPAQASCADHGIVTGSIDVAAPRQSPQTEKPAEADRQLEAVPTLGASPEQAPTLKAAVAMHDAEPTVKERSELPNSAPDNPGDTSGRQVADAATEQVKGNEVHANDVAMTSPQMHASAQVENPVAPVPCSVEAAAIAGSIEVRFDFASASLHHAGWDAMDRLAAALRQCPEARMIIEGHTDSDGDFYRNQSLSVRRALAVRQYLIDAGAGDGQLMVVGYGQERPLAPNDTDANKSRNRRIEIVIK